MRKIFGLVNVSMVSAVLALVVMIGSPAAHADALDDAKVAGIVGEQLDGYLGIVSAGAGADVQVLVQDINLRRRENYRSIVAKTPGSTLSAVEALAGRKIIGMTPAGQYVQSPSGEWVRK